ncbi:MAG: S9 family peptidase [Planctomycetota bacterium]
MLTRRLAPLAALLALAPLPAQDDAAPQKDPGRVDLDMLLQWENVSDPHLSPDGRQIVYTRQWTDSVEDRMRSELWIMDVDGSRQRFLCKGSDADWSPDGTRLCYIAEGEPKGAQIFVLWLDTREVTPVTHVGEAPSNLQWSPDGRQIAFDMQVPEKDGFPIAMPKAPKGAKWAEDAKVITRLSYRRDREGYRPAGFRHIFVVDATGGTPRQLTSGDYDHGAPQWADHGRQIVFDGLRVADADWQVEESELYALNVDTGAVRPLTMRRGPDRSPLVLADDTVFYVGHDYTPDTYDVDHLYALSLNGEPKPRCLTADLDRAPQGLQRARGSGEVLFGYEDEGGIRAARIGGKGKLQTLTAKDVQFRVADELPSGALLGTMTTPTEPSTIAIREADGSFKSLTAVNADILQGKKLATTEEMWWDGPGGMRVQGWLVKPTHFEPTKKYPLILKIHGGPHAMYGVGFDVENQLHAAEGCLVLYCNPRGSTGYGKSFGNAIDNAYPGQDYDDLMAGVDAVIGKGCVDTSNLFVYGGSGGGVLTAWIVGHTDRFRAAVSMFPVIDWISFVGTTDGPYWYTNFEKLPWEDITEHWNRSPLKYVGHVTTPTMLITGELDLRTPMGQTEEFYQALKLRKVDSVMVRVPDEYHGAAGRHVSNRLRRFLYVQTWFKKHMSGTETVEAAHDKR